ncbi:MAG: DUF72 domain-containing protein [Cytophagaceae bacterium]|nr:DUF72 domain-containing protein [Gemmatimonadaceae bacterium]
MKTYALHFPVVEVQNTFYEPPPDATLEKWRALTPPSLEYIIKVWQLVTHVAKSPTYRRMKRPLGGGRGACTVSVGPVMPAPTSSCGP